MGAATRYLSQRYTAPWGQVKAGLTDIGTEELAHIEIVSADRARDAGAPEESLDHQRQELPQDLLRAQQHGRLRLGRYIFLSIPSPVSFTLRLVPPPYRSCFPYI